MSSGPRGATLGESLEHAAASAAVVGFVDRREGVERRSWTALRERAGDTAGRLQRLGVAAGDRVGLVYPTGPEFLQALLGTLLMGAVPVPLYPPVRLGRLDEYHERTAFLLRRVGATLLLVDRRSRRLLGPTVEKAALERGCRTLEELPQGDYRPRVADADELALVQFSSGTTVEPKPVALTHRQILAQVRALNSFWPPDGERVPSGVSWLPLYHDMGLVGCIFTALDYPGDLTLIPPELFVARPSIWLRVLSRTRAVISPAPNFAYGLCVDKIRDEELDGVDLSSWRVALCGAETVVPEVLRAFTRRFAPWGFRAEALSPVYGLSEATLAVTFSALERPFVSRFFDRRTLAEQDRALVRVQPVEPKSGLEISAVGRPLPGFSLSIRNDAGEERAEGEVGTVWIQGPSLMSGYLGPSGETVCQLDRGWLDTGDRGFLLDGELYLTGRVKDILIVRGRNHLPEEVELALDPLGGVRTGCTAAVGHLEDGAASESLWVFVEHSTKSREGRAELAEECRRAILSASGLEAARVIVLEPGTLPRTSSGKIRRQETLRRYLAESLLPPAPVHAVGILGEMVRSRSALKRAEKRRRGG